MHVIVEGESPSLAAIVEREVQVAVFKRITVRPEQMGVFRASAGCAFLLPLSSEW